MNKKWLSSSQLCEYNPDFFFPGKQFGKSTLNLTIISGQWRKHFSMRRILTRKKKNPHEHSDNKTTGQTPLPCCFISNSCGTQNLYGFQAVRELIWQCEILAGRIRFEEVMKSSRNGSRNLKAGGTALSPDTAAVVHRKL